ncbi:MAG: TlpA family protein disulfide reductase [Balneolales bacterium]|nr:TlpA family protein disulfide reductase [Balneolales bacterium]
MSVFKKSYTLPILIIGMSFTALFSAVRSEGGAYCPFNTSSFNPNPPSTEQTNTQGLVDAPDFTLTNMEGEQFTLSDHKGKVIVLNIWATWCPPCREEIPDFIELQNEMKNDGVLFVGVSVDEKGWDVVRPFAQEFKINYPLVIDDGTIYAKYGPLPGLPTSFIINKLGQIEHFVPGMVSKAQLLPVLQELAAQ